jgi:septum formation protein
MVREKFYQMTFTRPLCNVKLILASSSPRRAHILRQIGIPFTAIPGNVCEFITENLSAEEIVREFARLKVESVRSSIHDGIILGADTIVTLGRNILGKPKSNSDALRMLRLLNGKRHQVLTALYLYDVQRKIRTQGIEKTWVTFRKLKEREMKWYLDTGESFDKAGSYGIQGHGSLLIKAIEGCYYNVVGLPIGLFLNLLEFFIDE